MFWKGLNKFKKSHFKYVDLHIEYIDEHPFLAFDKNFSATPHKDIHIFLRFKKMSI